MRWLSFTSYVSKYRNIKMKDTPTNEFLPANSLSVILGLYDRRKDVEAQRLALFPSFYISSSWNRKKIRVSKVIVHKNFTNHANDIALLKLGEEIRYSSVKHLKWKDGTTWNNPIAEQRVDLSKYPPACLPQKGKEFAVGTTAFVYGGWCVLQL